MMRSSARVSAILAPWALLVLALVSATGQTNNQSTVIFCYRAQYLPTVHNAYALAVTYSGLLQLDGNVSDRPDTAYSVVAVSGERRYTTLYSVTDISSLSFNEWFRAPDNRVVVHPSLSDVAPVSASGMSFTLSPAALFTGSDSLAGYNVNLRSNDGRYIVEDMDYDADSPTPVAQSLLLAQYNESIKLTAGGGVSSCSVPAPDVQKAFSFVFCYLATFVPSPINGNLVSVTYSGVLSTRPSAYASDGSGAGLTPLRGTNASYLVRSVIGERNYTTLDGSQLSTLSYPPVPVDSEVFPDAFTQGTVINAQGLELTLSPPAIVTGYPSVTSDTAFLYSADGSTVIESMDASHDVVPPDTVSLTIQPYSSSIPLTVQGTLPSCQYPRPVDVPETNDSQSTIAVGTLVGVIVGAVLVFALAICCLSAVCVYCRRKRSTASKLEAKMRRSSSSTSPRSMPVGSGPVPMHELANSTAIELSTRTTVDSNPSSGFSARSSRSSADTRSNGVSDDFSYRYNTSGTMALQSTARTLTSPTLELALAVDDDDVTLAYRPNQPLVYNYEPTGEE